MFDSKTFKRLLPAMPNALETIRNEAFQMIIVFNAFGTAVVRCLKQALVSIL
jgi:hypothetical protein